MKQIIIIHAVIDLPLTIIINKFYDIIIVSLRGWGGVANIGRWFDGKEDILILNAL
jgi:hypothetical protein